jgi:hypothetical protein
MPQDQCSKVRGAKSFAACFHGRITEATSWVKIKNREYSQAVGSEDLFDRQKTRE